MPVFHALHRTTGSKKKPPREARLGHIDPQHFGKSRIMPGRDKLPGCIDRPTPGDVWVLPLSLTRYFADSRLEVESFSRLERTLTVRIEKEIGPETGILTFRQVAFMALPTLMPGEAIRSRPVREAGPEFFSLCRLDEREFDH